MGVLLLDYIAAGRIEKGTMPKNPFAVKSIAVSYTHLDVYKRQTILRDGKYVADADVKDIELSWIVENMVGKNTRCV